MKTRSFHGVSRLERQRADSKQPMLPAPTMHCTPPFCIELCSVELLDPVVLEGRGPDELEFGDDGE